jgi:uncharacterized RDD family membrane protein YckC
MSVTQELPPSELSVKETREIVTPYAFGVAPDLLGKKLATPFRRALAQLIDLFLVALLSKANALFLGFFAALAVFRAGQSLSNNNEQTVARRGLRLISAILLFWVTFSLVQLYQGAQEIGGIDGGSDERAGLVLGMVQSIAVSACEEESACLANVAEEFGTAMADSQSTREDVVSTLEEMLDGQSLDASLNAAYRAAFLQAYDNARGGLDEVPASDITEDSPSQIVLSVQPEPVEAEYSVVKWLKGIIADLGLGFGWAALYYSVFTAWWRGHTPGKRLCRIKVLKIDGSELTLWESFGRYGGYGAGLATGLLGFLQIYWDANRQAIQDKIAETLVIVEDGGNKTT